MDPYPAQQRLFHTGSVSGFRPVQQLGSHYLAAMDKVQQPLCGNKEGWGPLSPFRYDFTPCFIDVWVATVAVFGLLLGPIAIWYLKTKKQQTEEARNVHFYVKQVRRLMLLSMPNATSHRPC